jgi:hypothetical protein
VADAISQQMNQGIFHLFENALVDFNFAALDDEVRFLALVPAKVANDSREKRAHRRQRQHEQLF